MTNPEPYERAIWEVEHEFYGPGGEADTFAATLLARWLLSRQRHEVIVIDTGFGLSERPRTTGQPFTLNDYPTVETFLAEPSGHTFATHLSGAGLAAESLAEDFNHEWAEAETAFALERLQPHTDDEEFDLIEQLSNEAELVPVRISWLETFHQRSLAEVVAPYLEAAKQQLASKTGRQDVGPND